MLLAPFLYAALEYHSGWAGTVITGALAFFIFAWWRSFSVQIRDGLLVYTTLFSPRREINLKNIKNISRKVERVPAGGRPPNRLEVYGEVDGHPVAFDINMKVFSLQGGRELEAMLASVVKSKTSGGQVH